MPDCMVFCEARGDAEIAQSLADRVVREAVSGGEGVATHLRWRGDRHPVGAGDVWFVKWTALKPRSRRLKVHGRYGGPNKGEYVQARKALMWSALEHPEVEAVILMRDDDGFARRADFEAARDAADGARAVVIALAEPEQEAWCLVAFDPADAAERARFEALRARLGGHPHAVAHTLSPKRDDHPKGTKRALAELCDGERARAVEGLSAIPLETLRGRGAAVGLAAYLDDLVARLVPVLGAG